MSAEPVDVGDCVVCASLDCGCPDLKRPEDVGLMISVGAHYLITAVGHSGDGHSAVEIADWPSVPFCPGHFRRIGPSRAETISRFAEDLSVREMERVR